MKELKFSGANEDYIIEQIESLEKRNEFGCIFNFCPTNSLTCFGNLF